MAQNVNESPSGGVFVCATHVLVKTDVLEVFFGAVNVDRFGCDVHIAAPQCRLFGRQVFCEVTTKPGIPLKLVFVLRGAELESVRHIRIDNRNSAHNDSHQTSVIDLRPLIVKSVENGLGRHTRQHGHSVV